VAVGGRVLQGGVARTGDIPGWHQIFADDFPTDVPIGCFSGCDQGTARTCTGLPSAVEAKWWAYPDGWKDTGGQGTYSPSRVCSRSPSLAGLSGATNRAVGLPLEARDEGGRGGPVRLDDLETRSSTVLGLKWP